MITSIHTLIYSDGVFRCSCLALLQDFAKFFSGWCHVTFGGAGDTAYLPVSAACLPNFFKSRSNVSRSFFERTSAIFSIAVACSPNPRVIT